MANNSVEFFFFSSRRRHTRLQGDWSSDVCSSDLLDRGEEHWVVRVEGGVRGLDDLRAIVVAPAHEGRVAATVGDVATVRLGEATRNGAVSRDGRGEAVQGLDGFATSVAEIGRAHV